MGFLVESMLIKLKGGFLLFCGVFNDFVFGFIGVLLVGEVRFLFFFFVEGWEVDFGGRYLRYKVRKNCWWL